MTDNRKNNKKRFIYACPVVPGGGFDNEGNLYLQMTYVLDSGNLISDVQKELQTKTVCIHNNNYEYKAKIYDRCIRARDKLKHDLESAIRATGANRFNAEITAKKLLEKMRY